ncbi:DUF4976 domain-containing protein [Lacticaseibacillus paracasei]|nr:sulfatase/phosphatase domain-containing protein [Lacticaseibacillus paracasei]QBA73249.1 DUF4976 domain-containing protein [Lacticaseibacillus paracasei]
MLCKHHFSKNGQVFFHIFWVVTLIMQSRSQYILTDKWKFIWFSVRDEYQLFDMEKDPHEMKNLINNSKYSPVIRELKQKLISYLFNREERFVKEGRLKPISVENIKSTLNSPLAGKDGLNEI